MTTAIHGSIASRICTARGRGLVAEVLQGVALDVIGPGAREELPAREWGELCELLGKPVSMAAAAAVDVLARELDAAVARASVLVSQPARPREGVLASRLRAPDRRGRLAEALYALAYACWRGQGGRDDYELEDLDHLSDGLVRDPVDAAVNVALEVLCRELEAAIAQAPALSTRLDRLRRRAESGCE